uniref:Uncharacterized protein n=1 Tax=Oryza meridionalis TaxID=40149 RepID=A0A0E0CLC0_9ORYZ
MGNGGGWREDGSVAWETRATARLVGGTQVAAANDTGRLGAAGGSRATPASLVVAALVEKLGRLCGIEAVPAGTLCAVVCGGGCSLVAAVGEVVPMGSSGVLGRRRSVSRGQCGILATVVSADWLGAQGTIRESLAMPSGSGNAFGAVSLLRGIVKMCSLFFHHCTPGENLAPVNGQAAAAIHISSLLGVPLWRTFFMHMSSRNFDVSSETSYFHTYTQHGENVQRDLLLLGSASCFVAGGQYPCLILLGGVEAALLLGRDEARQR